MDKTRLLENEVTNLQAIKRQTMNELRVATFGYITKVNTITKTVNVQPIVKEGINSKTGVVHMKLPEILNVPYFSKMGDPSLNEYCICIHLDRSIKGTDINSNKRDLINSTSNRHSIEDCVAITGFGVGSFVNKLNIYNIGIITLSSTEWVADGSYFKHTITNSLFKNNTTQRLDVINKDKTFYNDFKDAEICEINIKNGSADIYAVNLPANNIDIKLTLFDGLIEL